MAVLAHWILVDVQEVAGQAGIAVHGVKEADRKVPLIGDSHKGESLADPGDGRLNLGLCGRAAVTAVVAREQPCIASRHPGDEVCRPFLHNTVHVIYNVGGEALNRIAKEAHEVALIRFVVLADAKMAAPRDERRAETWTFVHDAVLQGKPGRVLRFCRCHRQACLHGGADLWVVQEGVPEGGAALDKVHPEDGRRHREPSRGRGGGGVRPPCRGSAYQSISGLQQQHLAASLGLVGRPLTGHQSGARAQAFVGRIGAAQFGCRRCEHAVDEDQCQERHCGGFREAAAP
mmetsp:Transcript_78792/g.231177  ORF Transcript_78792/g.231177 Transcript_78792/m.231177 type:complete len:289 (-) Transcript_78792:25-891(-)